MLFNSINFLIFFPIVTLIYYVVPKQIKQLWLLIASYYFYMSWNAKYALLLFVSTFVTYLSGLALGHLQKNHKFNNKAAQWILAFSFIINIGLLVFFKYADFLITSINTVLSAAKFQIIIPKFDVLLPVGISFYTFQALGYTMDVYRGKIYSEKNFLKYALFVSFFPQLVAGPIERSENLLRQLSAKKNFNFSSFLDGILLMIWGFFLKLIIADRAAIIVNTVYGDLNTYGGTYIITATILFAFQIYCDFYGYSVIAKGAAEVLGIDLMNNFNAPYLSTTVSEFWRRWHISLSSWFKDYLYIPLGGNRKGTFKKHINIMIVFAVSGLWHGANWTYIIWGILNGFYQIIGEWLREIRNWVNRILCLDKNSLSHKLVQTVVTFALVDFAWIFFRASSVEDAFTAIKSIYTIYNPWVLFDGSMYLLGLDQKNFQLLIYALIILCFADVCNYRGIQIRSVILKQEYWFKSAVIMGGGIIYINFWHMGGFL